MSSSSDFLDNLRLWGALLGTAVYVYISFLDRHLVNLIVFWLIELSQNATCATFLAILGVSRNPGVAIFAPIFGEWILDYVVFEAILGGAEADN